MLLRNFLWILLPNPTTACHETTTTTAPAGTTTTSAPTAAATARHNYAPCAAVGNVQALSSLAWSCIVHHHVLLTAAANLTGHAQPCLAGIDFY